MSTRSFMAGERPSKKPIVPLRYRIDPTAKKLDDIDALELELERCREQYPEETYYELFATLQRQREAIHKKIDKANPVVYDKVGAWDGPMVPAKVKPRMSASRIIAVMFIIWLVFKIV